MALIHNWTIVDGSSLCSPIEETTWIKIDTLLILEALKELISAQCHIPSGFWQNEAVILHQVSRRIYLNSRWCHPFLLFTKSQGMLGLWGFVNLLFSDLPDSLFDFIWWASEQWLVVVILSIFIVCIFKTTLRVRLGVMGGVGGTAASWLLIFLMDRIFLACGLDGLKF